MRLSTNIIFQQQAQGISAAQSDWLATGLKLSSGKRVSKPSDDPIAASQAIAIQQNQRSQKRFGIAQQFAQNTMGIEASSLSALSEDIQAALSEVIYGSTGTLNDDDRSSVAVKLEGIRNQILDIANTQDSDGRYIFAGYKTGTQPFIDGAQGVSYQGGTDPITQQVNAERSMILSHTGEQVFLSTCKNPKPEPDGSAGETDLFAILDQAITTLKTPIGDGDEEQQKGFQEAMNKANRGLTNSFNNILTLQSENGTQLAELDSLSNLNSDRDVMVQGQLSQLVDTDMTQTISDYQMKQTALQASYTVFTQMSKLSLFQLNK